MRFHLKSHIQDEWHQHLIALRLLLFYGLINKIEQMELGQLNRLHQQISQMACSRRPHCKQQPFLYPSFLQYA